MPGLRAEELPSERLSVGKQIAYYLRRFVTGDTRGQRVAVVMSVDDTPGNELPVSLDAGDSLLLTVFMRRSHDVLGNELNLEHVKWRKLASSYPTMSGVLQRVPSRHRKQPVFLQPREDKDHAPVEVDWPKDVVKIYKCLNPSKIRFKDRKDLQFQRIMHGYTIFYSMRSTKNKFVVEAVKAGSITLFISQRSSQTLRSLKVLVLMVKNVKSDPIFAHYLKPDVQVEDVQEVTSIREVWLSRHPTNHTETKQFPTDQADRQ
ncbi:hypothetical protein L917_01777 [Phytophthora nicotianae]|uniref:Uncharacterized protein n=1 Tax=Phytophthora nicotianae TaxID=4792 RepID=W2LYE5_PHYNI|nr:hypothetical protein L917_01777 [Phytophthora nicotianae]